MARHEYDDDNNNNNDDEQVDVGVLVIARSK
jgi:hypothetical protein